MAALSLVTNILLSNSIKLRKLPQAISFQSSHQACFGWASIANGAEIVSVSMKLFDFQCVIPCPTWWSINPPILVNEHIKWFSIHHISYCQLHVPPLVRFHNLIFPRKSDQRWLLLNDFVHFVWVNRLKHVLAFKQSQSATSLVISFSVEKAYLFNLQWVTHVYR